MDENVVVVPAFQRRPSPMSVPDAFIEQQISWFHRDMVGLSIVVHDRKWPRFIDILGNINYSTDDMGILNKGTLKFEM